MSEHNHGHDHAHAPTNFNRAFAVGIALNVLFVVVEAFYGWKVNSLALLADAAHNLSDVAGLVLAWGGALASQLKPDARHTYGWQRGTIMAALINAILLLLAMGSLGWEAVQRLQTQEATEGWTVIGVAAVGIVVNTVTALLFMKDRKDDLNIRGAFLHMAADALVSVGVVLGGVLYLWQGWAWIDPVMSLLIAAVIVVGTWSLFHQSLHMMFDGVPLNLDLHQVHGCLMALPGVVAVHDLHVWAMSTSQVALTAHLVVADASTDSGILLANAQEELDEHFQIQHVTLQVETAEHARHCALRTHGSDLSADTPGTP
ncbi:cation diffusion facilitator family transporter [Malikia granosa]|uniref:cation diffusion facilitator family transporter n=1 Tax=Malikia granosa TaxID=263067 RepID=UPI0026D44C77